MTSCNFLSQSVSNNEGLKNLYIYIYIFYLLQLSNIKMTQMLNTMWISKNPGKPNYIIIFAPGKFLPKFAVVQLI